MTGLPDTLHIACGQCGATVALLVEPIQVHPAAYTDVTTTVLAVDTRLYDLHHAQHHPKEA